MAGTLNSPATLFHGLTEAQASAVRHLDGPMLTLAGPGSGKTRVVTHRIAHLIQNGVPGRKIAALTFTNKAAEEMRARVESLAPGQRVWMGTFHRFCARLLRRYAGMGGLAENYSIYDTSDSKAALKRAIAAAGVSTTHASPEQIAQGISHAKNRLVTPDMMQGQMLSPRDTLAAKVYPVYQQQLLTANAVDFDDLLLHVARLLRENPEIRSQLDARYRYILVDEYQDTNLAQYAIVRAMSIDHPNLAVTGDPDQSIYGWRGADLNNILDFEKDYPNVKVVRLEKNYRSTPNILRVADQLIRHNSRRKAKELFTDNAEGDPVTLRMFEDGFEEADAIADDIVAAVSAGQAKPSDFAIFCRMNALTRSLEHAMRSRGIPYQIAGGVEFYQRKEIKDLLAYLHLINNPNHDVALQRIINTPTRGIGDKTVARLRAHADGNQIPMLEAARRAGSIEDLPKRSATMVAKFVAIYDRLAVKATATLEDLLRYVVEEIDYEGYLQRSAPEAADANPMANVDEFITAAVEFDRRHPEDGSLELFLEQVALVADTDAIDGEVDRLTMMTLHAAKGLEFPRVYIVGVEDDLIPHKRSKETEAEFEEERRLLFVGITRAEQALQLSLCKRRSVRGETRPVIPSPFLNELPLDEMRRQEPTTARGDWFDDDGIDQSYPDSWDLPDMTAREAPATAFGEQPVESDDQSEQGSVDPPVGESFVADMAEIDRSPPAKRSQSMPKRKAAALAASLKTGSDLLAGGGAAWITFTEGTRVKHAEFGVGEIVAVSGRGPKRIAKVRFDDGEHSFRLAHARLELA